MKLNEVYVLNLALDGAEIYALPELKAPLTDFIISSIKDGLVAKRILKSHNSFTNEGIRFTQKLNLYKSAVKYISTNHISIGLLEGNKGITLNYNPFFDSYTLNKVHFDDVISSFVEAYPFLQEESEAVEEQEKKLEIEVLRERFRIDEKKILTIKTKSKDVETHEEVFLFNNKFYLYNHMKQTLTQKNKETLLQIIEERVKIDE